MKQIDSKILTPVMLILLIILGSFAFKGQAVTQNDNIPEVLSAQTAQNLNTDLPFFKFDFVSANIKTIKFYTTVTGNDFEYLTHIDLETTDGLFMKEQYTGYLENVQFYYYPGFGLPKFKIDMETGQYIETGILEFDESTNMFRKVIFHDKDDSISETLCCSYVSVIPDKDGSNYILELFDFWGDKKPIRRLYRYHYEGTFIEI